MLGAPSASLRMTNLDLSSRGLVLDNNYAGNNLSIFIIDNNYSQPSAPTLFLASQVSSSDYSHNPHSSHSTRETHHNPPRIDHVATQFSQALGVTFTKAFALPYGGSTITIYAPTPNSQTTMPSHASSGFYQLKLLNPHQPSKSTKPAILRGDRSRNNKPPSTTQHNPDPSLRLPPQHPVSARILQAGLHNLSLKTLLGFKTGIVGDTNSNASIVSISFQRGTVLYSPLGLTPPYNPLYDNLTATYVYNATITPRADFAANFTYPFAPNITVQKTVTPSSGPLRPATTSLL